MNLRQLELFVAVAEAGSFSRGAEAVSLTQSTVSQHIAALENEVELRLLDRTGQGALLTTAGELFLRHSRRVLAEHEAMRQALAGFHGLQRAGLSVGASNIPANYLVPEILPRMAAEHPGIDLRVHTGDSRAMLELLQADGVELAVIGSRGNERGLDYRPLADDLLVLAIGRRYPWLKSVRNRSIDLEDLATLPLVVREAGSGSDQALRRALRQADFDPHRLRIVARLGSNEAVRQALLNGAGAAFLSEISIRQELQRGELVRVSVRNFATAVLAGDPQPAYDLAGGQGLHRSVAREIRDDGGLDMTRQEQLRQLKTDRVFDLLVIGGGATGCGVALDAASRGLKVALVEKNDFAEGTSSRSTKLVHGGVRYLEAAVKKFDPVQYRMVREGLRERFLLLRNAPHLCNRLPLVTPLYRWRDIPYVFAGLKLYDLLAGKRSIGHSRLLGRREALRLFPALKAEGLKGGVLYYDGQFHDARMALSLALTAGRHGAIVGNHVAATELLKENGRIAGARMTDSLTGESWPLKATGVINATGPFADRVRQMDDPAAAPIIAASSGIHIVLDARFAPPDTGLLIPETEDGRVLFVLPWEGHALVGTTDEPAQVDEHPRPQEKEIAYLLRHLGRYFNLQVARDDVKACWSGLRPLVRDPQAVDSASLARDHVIEVSNSGLLTIAGGKWTTYRKMAEDTVDQAVQRFGLTPQHAACQTEQLPILGGENYVPQGVESLSEQFGFDADIAAYLHRTYGDQAKRVAQLVGPKGQVRLVEGHPIIEAEITYAARHEMAERAIDVLARRTPLALLDTDASRQALSRVVELMAVELRWGERRCCEELKLAEKRLSMGL